MFVKLKKAGVPIEKVEKEHYTKVNRVFELSRAAMINEKETIHSEFPIRQTHLSYDEMQHADQIVLLTEIQVYQNERIEIAESGLTVPMIIDTIRPSPETSINIETQYVIGVGPKLDYRIKK